MNPAPDITFVLTSCGRFDLLAKTMSSFLEHNTAPIARYVVIEDSGDAAVHDVIARFGLRAEVIVNATRLGQMASIDRAYRTVETPWIFHCEDDWRFFRRGFVEESHAVLEGDDAISMVNPRRLGENPLYDAIQSSAAVRKVNGVDVRVPASGAHEIWGGYEFNPGLRRLSDYLRLGSFAARGHEKHASSWFKRRGMASAGLADPACETIGHGRHVVDPTLPEGAYLHGRSRPPGVFAAPGSRNDPCPCGSGERYKHCHGLSR